MKKAPTYVELLAEYNYEYRGIWDKCCLTENSKDGGLIVWDKEEKQEKYLTWFEFHKMVKKKEKELRNEPGNHNRKNKKTA